jgi:DHA2 family multidrug resistance protein
VGLPRGKNEQASALLNLARNLGGSVGISLMEALIARRSQFHQGTLVAHITRFSPILRRELAVQAQALTHAGANAVAGARMAYGLAYAEVQRQAAALAYADVFQVLGMLAVCSVPIALFLRAEPGGQAQVPAH